MFTLLEIQWIFVYPLTDSSIHPSIHPHTYPNITYSSINLVSMQPSTYQSMHLFIFPFICLSIHLSTYSPIYPRTHGLPCQPIDPLIQQQHPNQMIASHLAPVPRPLSRTQPPCAAPGRQLCHHGFPTHCPDLLPPSYCLVLLAQCRVPHSNTDKHHKKANDSIGRGPSFRACAERKTGRLWDPV